VPSLLGPSCAAATLIERGIAILLLADDPNARNAEILPEDDDRSQRPDLWCH